MTFALLVYGLGVLIGFAVMRDRFVPRLVTALSWPIGPATGLLVVGGLLVVAIILWPVPMIAGAAIVGSVLYLLA